MNSKLLFLIGFVAGVVAFFLAASWLGVDLTKSGAQNGARGIAAVGIAVLVSIVVMALAAPSINRADRSELAVTPRLREQALGRKDPRYKDFIRARSLYLGYLSEHRISDIPYGVTPAQRAAARHDSGLAEAERLFIAACDGAINAGSQPDAAVAWYQLGLLYQLQGRLDEAPQAMRNALGIFDNLPQLASDHQEIQSNCHYVLGKVALEQGDRVLARSALESALKIDTARHDRRAQAETRAALARCDDNYNSTYQSLLDRIRLTRLD